MKSASKTCLALAIAVALGLPAALNAAKISMTAIDGSTDHSFDTAGHWSNGQAPGPANNYFTAGYTLRTSATAGGSDIFLGNSLQIDATPGGPSTHGIIMKYGSPGGSITVTNLIFNGGGIQNGVGGTMNVYGHITILTNSYLLPGNSKTLPANTFLVIYAPITGGSTNTMSIMNLNSTTTPGNTATAVLVGDNSAYSGNWYIYGETIQSPNFYMSSRLQVGNGGTTGNLGTGRVTNQNVLTFNRSDAFVVPNLITGTGTVVQAGSGQLTLSGTNTYSGSTVVSAGTLALSGNGSISNSANIILSGGTTFDVSAGSAAFTLGGSQTLSNSSSTATLNCGTNGFGSGSGTVSLTYASGTPALIVTNGKLTLASGTVFNVNNTGGTLGAGSYKLIGALTGGSVAGSLPAVAVSGGGTTAPATLQIISGELYLVVGSNSVELTSSAPTNGYLTVVTFTAAVQTNGVTAGNATGMMQLNTNGVAYLTNGLAGGSTNFSLLTLPRGTNLITAIYSGDSNYLPSTNSLNQVVTNHPPMANLMTVTRTAGLALKIALSDVATNWTDSDGDKVSLTGVTMQSTNGINLAALNWTTNLDGSIVTTNAFAYLGYNNGPNVSDQISYSLCDGHGGTVIGFVNLVLTNGVTGTNCITAFSFGTSSNTITAYGIPGLSYILERATNLTSPVWVDVHTNLAATNGIISAADTFGDLGGIPPSPSAFYQLKWQP